jgi:hypothetical protein
MMFGLALQSLQVFAHPEGDHILQEKYADESEEDDEGDPDDPQKVLARQLRCIRNGETVDRLLVPLSEEGKNAKTVMWSLLRGGGTSHKKEGPAQLGPLCKATATFDGGAACFGCAMQKNLVRKCRASGGGP